MAPLHHHFELVGWDEEKITLRFWIVAILAGLLGVTLFLASINALADMAARRRSTSTRLTWPTSSRVRWRVAR